MKSLLWTIGGCALLTLIAAYPGAQEKSGAPEKAGEDPSEVAKASEFDELLEKRAPLYKQIENVVDTRGRSLDAVVEDVLRIYRGPQSADQSRGQ